MKNSNSVKITGMILVTVVVLFLISLIVYFQIKPSQTVASNGIAVVKAVPDLVSVYFNVETEGETAKEAKDKNAEIVDKVITGLVKLGLERKDIVTENFNVYPNYVYRNNEQKQEGYKAVHSLKVKLDADSNLIGDVIDAGVDNEADIGYINFELSQELQNKYKAEALQKATEDARFKAEGIANGLGKSLGKVVSISTSDFDYYPWRLYEASGVETDVAMAKEATTNIQPGERDISGRVSVVFALK